jgi:hypothetical protein
MKNRLMHHGSSPEKSKNLDHYIIDPVPFNMYAYSMLRGRLQLIIYFRLFLEFDLVFQTWI